MLVFLVSAYFTRISVVALCVAVFGDVQQLRTRTCPTAMYHKDVPIRTSTETKEKLSELLDPKKS